MTCIYRENFSYLRKQSLLCASSGVFLQVCITGVNRTLFPFAFECPSANLKSCIKYAFACIVFKANTCKHVKGGNYKILKKYFV